MIDAPQAAPLDEQRFAVPIEKAVSISGLSRRQVDYWANTGLVQPSIDTELAGRRVRLYGFRELLALTIAAELRTTHGLWPQYIRRIVQHLQSRGYEDPLTELRFAVVRKVLYFQHPDGSWEGGLRPDQLVEHRVLELEPLRRRIVERSGRDPAAAGKVEKRRGTLGSKPVFVGTRIPVDTVVRYLDAGRTVDDVLEAFPDLTREDIAAVAEVG
ncbi:MAG: DUF433 domain-containing protein [Pseudonocardiaceae bacterium]